MEIDLTMNIQKLLNEPNGRLAFGIYVASCLGGQLASAFWLWLNKKIPTPSFRFNDDPRSTAVSIILNLAGILGVAIAMPWAAVPYESAFFMGILQGFRSDSAVNKNNRMIWTEEQRKAAAEKNDAPHPP